MSDPKKDAARLVELIVRQFGRIEVDAVEDYDSCGVFHYPRRGDKKTKPPSQKRLPRR